MSPTSRKFLIGAAVVGAVLAGGAGIAAAGGPGEMGDDVPLTGKALKLAGAAALDASRAYGEDGRVVDTETEGDEGTYEVEVALPDGSQVEFEIDPDSYDVVGQPEVESQDEDAADTDD